MEYSKTKADHVELPRLNFLMYHETPAQSFCPNIDKICE